MHPKSSSWSETLQALRSFFTPPCLSFLFPPVSFERLLGPLESNLGFLGDFLVWLVWQDLILYQLHYVNLWSTIKHLYLKSFYIQNYKTCICKPFPENDWIHAWWGLQIRETTDLISHCSLLIHDHQKLIIWNNV